MRTVLALAVALSAAAFGGGGSASAVPPDAYGYWWKAQTGVGPFLVPPTVPQGGLWVARDAAGDHAVAALRFEAEADTVATTLVLVAREATGTPLLSACPTSGTWGPVAAGAWADRPVHDCTAKRADGAVAADGKTWTFDVAELADGAVLDLVVVPTPSATAPFSVSFDPPTESTLATAPAGGSGTSTGGGEELFTPPPAASMPFVPTDPAAFDAPAPSGGLAAPVSGFDGNAFESAPPEAVVETVTTTPAGSTSAAPTPARSPGGGAKHPLALVVVGALAAVWVLRSRAAAGALAAHPLARPVAVGRDGTSPAATAALLVDGRDA